MKLKKTFDINLGQESFKTNTPAFVSDNVKNIIELIFASPSAFRELSTDLSSNLDYFKVYPFAHPIISNTIGHMNEHGCFPNVELLHSKTLNTILNEYEQDNNVLNGLDGKLRGVIVSLFKTKESFLTNYQSPSSIIKYVRERLIDFSLYNQVTNIKKLSDISLYNSEAFKTNVSTINQLINTNLDNKSVLSFDDEDMYSVLSSSKSKIPFRNNWLNVVTNGGAYRGQLVGVLSPINGGKSLTMVSLGCDYIRDGYNVIFVTKELYIPQYTARVMGNLSGIDHNRFQKMGKNEINALSNACKVEGYGQWSILKVSNKNADSDSVASMIEARINKGYKQPDVIIIDYLSIFNPSNRDDNRKPTHEKEAIVSEEFRDIADKFSAICITAAQVDRSSQGNSKEITLANIAGSLGLAKTADFMISVVADNTFSVSSGAVAYKLTVLKTRLHEQRTMNTYVYLSGNTNIMRLWGNSLGSIPEELIDKTFIRNEYDPTEISLDIKESNTTINLSLEEYGNIPYITTEKERPLLITPTGFINHNGRVFTLDTMKTLEETAKNNNSIVPKWYMDVKAHIQKLNDNLDSYLLSSSVTPLYNVDSVENKLSFEQKTLIGVVFKNLNYTNLPNEPSDDNREFLRYALNNIESFQYKGVDYNEKTFTDFLQVICDDELSKSVKYDETNTDLVTEFKVDPIDIIETQDDYDIDNLEDLYGIDLSEIDLDNDDIGFTVPLNKNNPNETIFITDNREPDDIQYDHDGNLVLENGIPIKRVKVDDVTTWGKSKEYFRFMSVSDQKTYLNTGLKRVDKGNKLEFEEPAPVTKKEDSEEPTTRAYRRKYKNINDLSGYSSVTDYINKSIENEPLKLEGKCLPKTVDLGFTRFELMEQENERGASSYGFEGVNVLPQVPLNEIDGVSINVEQYVYNEPSEYVKEFYKFCERKLPDPPNNQTVDRYEVMKRQVQAYKESLPIPEPFVVDDEIRMAKKLQTVEARNKAFKERGENKICIYDEEKYGVIPLVAMCDYIPQKITKEGFITPKGKTIKYDPKRKGLPDDVQLIFTHIEKLINA